MFKRIVIQMGTPICSCKKQDLTWSVSLNKSEPSKSGLIIGCKTCSTTLDVPYEKFVASFELERPYPEGVKPAAPPKREEPRKDTSFINIFNFKPPSGSN